VLVAAAFRVLVLLSAAAAPVAAAASDPKPAPREAREAQPRRGAEQPELICRSVEIAATREMPMVCMSAAEWRRAAEQ
jgi:hypothetical protein